MNDLSRVPPHSEEAERAILGSILLNNKAFGIVSGVITKNDFYLESNRRVFDAMATLSEDRNPIDALTISNILTEKGSLERVGGAIFLAGLSDSVATMANVEHYADIVKEKSQTRKMIVAAQRLLNDAYCNNGAEKIDDSVVKIIDASRQMSKDQMPDTIFQHGPAVLELYNKVAGGFRGIPLPWPTLDNIITGMWPGTFSMFVARPGVGKCQRFDTLVTDPTNGRYYPISEVVKSERKVLTRAEDGSISTVLPSAFLDMGEKECIRIKMASGRELSGTPEHPVMTVDGWKRMDELSTGDHVETVASTPEPINKLEPSDSEAILLGALLADGGYTNNRVMFNKQDEAILDAVRAACDDFDVDLRKTPCLEKIKSAWVISRRRPAGGRNCPNPVRLMLDRYGCGHKKSKDKVIPGEVFSFSNEKLALFLGMLIGCDGYVCSKDVGITLASKEMVYQIQRLLLRFGVLSSINYKKSKCNGKEFDAWRLRVYAGSIDNFKKIDLVSLHKKENLSKLSPGKHAMVGNIQVTDGIKQRIIEIVNAMTDSDRVKCNHIAADKLGWKNGFCANRVYRRDTVTRLVFEAFVSSFGLQDEFGHLLANAWDKIVDISDDGVHHVYDLTVDGTHSFVANDMVVHNSFLAIISAMYAWKQGYRVLIVSPEMSKGEMAERFFALDANVSYKGMVEGALSDFVYPKLEGKVEERLNAHGLYIMDATDDISLRGIESAVRKCKCQLLSMDSIYKLRIKGDRKERAVAALEWSTWASQEYNFAGMGYGQQNREAEKSVKKGGGSRLGTIALADEFGQDAHNVFALEQTQDEKHDGIIRVIPMKSRRGSITRPHIMLRWDFDGMLYGEMTEEEEAFIDKEEMPF